MSKNTAQSAADKAFEEALRTAGARDPREFYRERLRELKGTDPAAYEEAVRYYQDTLIPAVAEGSADPLQAWLEYGLRLANWAAPGEPVAVDRTGLRRPLEGPAPLDLLLLHVPSANGRALVVGIPAELSPAQRATYELLVRGRLKLRPVPEEVT